jgi:hypothetical protein
MERLGPLWRQPYTGTDFLAASRERMRALQARPCRFACAEPLRRRSAAIDRMRSFAKEPVNRQPDVLVGHTTGVVAALNRPGGNLTGVTSLNAAMGPKRLAPVRQLIAKAAVAAGTACSLSWRPFPVYRWRAGARPDHPISGPLLRERRAPYQ